MHVNTNIQPAFLRIIYAIALEISIKMNEQMLLALEDIVILFENRFNIKMLLQLERHILTLNNFRINPVTALDFLAYFLTDGLPFSEQLNMSPDRLLDLCLPIIHYCSINYQIRTNCNLRTIALASVWVAVQEYFQEQDHYDHEYNLAQKCLKEWFSSIATKYKCLD